MYALHYETYRYIQHFHIHHHPIKNILADIGCLLLQLPPPPPPPGKISLMNIFYKKIHFWGVLGKRMLNVKVRGTKVS